MATYYVRTGGSNAAAGTSPATAWQTLAKAMQTGSGVVGGDQVWIGAGRYAETFPLSLTLASEVKFTADNDGSHTGDAGEVVWTAFTSGDSAGAAASSLITGSGKPWYTFENITMVGGAASYPICNAQANQGANNWTFRRCVFLSITASISSSTAMIGWWGQASTAANWLFDSCLFFGHANAVELQTLLNASADHNINFVFKNCGFFLANGTAINVTAGGGSGTFRMGGIAAANCTHLGGGFFAAPSTTIATSIASTVKNCLIYSSNATAALNAGTSGQIVEDYNVISAPTPRTNVTAGTHTILGTAMSALVDIGQSWLRGFGVRPFLTPTSGSPLLGFGDDGTAPSVDALNQPRPAGGNSTAKGVGYLERHGTAIKETGTVDAGGVGLCIVGPGDHTFAIPVDAASTPITIKACYDATHAATNKPRAVLLDAPEIGVATQTVTMTAAVDTWEALTFAAITPTAKGVVWIRLENRAAATNGKSFFDTATVS